MALEPHFEHPYNKETYDIIKVLHVDLTVQILVEFVEKDIFC